MPTITSDLASIIQYYAKSLVKITIKVVPSAAFLLFKRIRDNIYF